MTNEGQKPTNERQEFRPLSYSIAQAASYLGVSLQSMRRWADRGELTSYLTPGGQRRFSKQHLEEFAEASKRRAK